MSADEIRRLADDCEKEARHIDEDAVVAFSNGDLRMKDVFDTISKTERKKASALLAYAAMVERCEEVRTNLELNRKDYANRGVCGSLVETNNDEIAMLNYILKGATDERKG